MTVKELIEKLKGLPDDLIVTIGEPEGPGWASIDKIREPECGLYGTIDLIPEQHPIFSES